LLCRTIVRDMEPRTFVSVISNPRLNPDDLLRQLLHDFGLLPKDEARATALTQHEMVTALQRFLASLAELRAHAIILIDEAQHLQPEVLEQVRLLSNFETGSLQLLQVVLVGQLDLDGVLNRPELRQLKQRVSRRHQLMPLQPHEVEQYVERRLWVAHGGLGLGKAAEFASGDRFWRVRFTSSAMRAVAQLSDGLPRSINVICDRALECAFNADKKIIDARCVIEAAEQLRLSVPVVVRVRSLRWQTVAASLALASAASWFAVRSDSGAETLVPPTFPVGDTRAREQTSQPPEDPEGAKPGPLSEATSFTVAVATFRTSARAGEIARSLKVLDLPAYVEGKTDGPHTVLVGPFVSRDEARQAQAQMERLSLTNSLILTGTTPSEDSTDRPDRPVRTSGE
jgi:general secretion pathway protein A